MGRYEFLRWILLPLLTAATSNAWPQNDAALASDAPLQLAAPESSRDSFGIVVNQTFTPGGMEFYRRFTDYWREQPNYDQYNLVIIERPSRRYGNSIFVVQNQEIVFSGSLPIKADAISALSLDATQKVYAKIVRQVLGAFGAADPDMGKSDF